MNGRHAVPPHQKSNVKSFPTFCPSDVFIPTPDSLLVNLKEGKEVSTSTPSSYCIVHHDTHCGFLVHAEVSTTKCFCCSWSRICWRVCRRCSARRWRLIRLWVQRCRPHLNSCPLPADECQSSRPNFPLWAQGLSSPEKTPVWKRQQRFKFFLFTHWSCQTYICCTQMKRKSIYWL